MNNREIASKFKLLGDLMELHDENAFKIRSYSNAYLTIRKLPEELNQTSLEKIEAIPGIGKAISSKIIELLESGDLQSLKKYRDKTPSGIIDLLAVKGLGAKKLKVIWKELGVESMGELMYAIYENRLLDLKGFGLKTQLSIKDQIEYFMESSGKQLYARIITTANDLISDLQKAYPDKKICLAGQLHQKNPIISKVVILTTAAPNEVHEFCVKQENIEGDIELKLQGTPVQIIQSNEENFYFELIKSSTGPSFFESLDLKIKNAESEKDVFEKNKLPYYIPEFREDENLEAVTNYSGANEIIELEDIKGCIHNHSTYSDGVNTMEEMLLAAKERNWEYFVLTDHSKSAFYANGLQEERLIQQIDEIQKLDQKYSDIRFFSGIESDILSNGELDYSDEILSQLDVVVASIHSNLKMDLEKATSRLIKAIENPYTNILGHPTGRLLLSRKAYPLDFKKIIDACSDNYVAIEMNANPLRLDIDWTHIQYAMSKNVLISINPDAHSTKGLDDTFFGVCAARKGGLTKSYCLNAFDLETFEDWMGEQHNKR